MGYYSSNSGGKFLPSLVLALGIAAAGWLVSNTIYKARMASNTVTVKGLAEQEVTANLGIWKLGFSVTGGDLVGVQKKADSNQQIIIDFLTKQGFKQNEIIRGSQQVYDFMSSGYNQNKISPQSRYKVDGEVAVRSDNVSLISQSIQQTGKIIEQGVVLTNTAAPSFKYTELNSIKPEMLKQATKNAREAAQQFAQDSGTKVGNIANAQQGYFSISGIDGFEYQADASVQKKVRVVTTVTFYLGE